MVSLQMKTRCSKIDAYKLPLVGLKGATADEGAAGIDNSMPRLLFTVLDFEATQGDMLEANCSL